MDYDKFRRLKLEQGIPGSSPVQLTTIPGTEYNGYVSYSDQEILDNINQAQQQSVFEQQAAQPEPRKSGGLLDAITDPIEYVASGDYFDNVGASLQNLKDNPLSPRSWFSVPLTAVGGIESPLGIPQQIAKETVGDLIYMGAKHDSDFAFTIVRALGNTLMAGNVIQAFYMFGRMLPEEQRQAVISAHGGDYKNRTSGSGVWEYLQSNLDGMPAVVRTPLRIAIELAMDPLTLVGVGAARNATKVGKLGRIGRSAEEFDQLSRSERLAARLSDIKHDPIQGIDAANRAIGVGSDTLFFRAPAYAARGALNQTGATRWLLERTKKGTEGENFRRSADDAMRFANSLEGQDANTTSIIDTQGNQPMTFNQRGDQVLDQNLDAGPWDGTVNVDAAGNFNARSGRAPRPRMADVIENATTTQVVHPNSRTQTRFSVVDLSNNQEWRIDSLYDGDVVVSSKSLDEDLEFVNIEDAFIYIDKMINGGSAAPSGPAAPQPPTQPQPGSRGPAAPQPPTQPQPGSRGPAAPPPPTIQPQPQPQAPTPGPVQPQQPLIEPQPGPTGTTPDQPAGGAAPSQPELPQQPDSTGTGAVTGDGTGAETGTGTGTDSPQGMDYVEGPDDFDGGGQSGPEDQVDRIDIGQPEILDSKGRVLDPATGRPKVEPKGTRPKGGARAVADPIVPEMEGIHRQFQVYSDIAEPRAIERVYSASKKAIDAGEADPYHGFWVDYANSVRQYGPIVDAAEREAKSRKWWADTANKAIARGMGTYHIERLADVYGTPLPSRPYHVSEASQRIRKLASTPSNQAIKNRLGGDDWRAVRRDIADLYDEALLSTDEAHVKSLLNILQSVPGTRPPRLDLGDAIDLLPSINEETTKAWAPSGWTSANRADIDSNTLNRVRAQIENGDEFISTADVLYLNRKYIEHARRNYTKRPGFRRQTERSPFFARGMDRTAGKFGPMDWRSGPFYQNDPEGLKNAGFSQTGNDMGGSRPSDFGRDPMSDLLESNVQYPAHPRWFGEWQPSGAEDYMSDAEYSQFLDQWWKEADDPSLPPAPDGLYYSDILSEDTGDAPRIDGTLVDLGLLDPKNNEQLTYMLAAEIRDNASDSAKAEASRIFDNMIRANKRIKNRGRMTKERATEMWNDAHAEFLGYMDGLKTNDGSIENPFDDMALSVERKLRELGGNPAAPTNYTFYPSDYDSKGGSKWMAAIDAGSAQGSRTPDVQDGYTRLYRGEAIPGSGDGVPSWVMDGLKKNGSLDAEGRWFTDDPAIAQWYIDEAGGDGRMVYVDIPSSELEQYRVSNLPETDKASRVSRDRNNEFFLPREYADQRLPITPDAPSGSVLTPEDYVNNLLFGLGDNATAAVSDATQTEVSNFIDGVLSGDIKIGDDAARAIEEPSAPIDQVADLYDEAGDAPIAEPVQLSPEEQAAADAGTEFAIDEPIDSPIPTEEARIVEPLEPAWDAEWNKPKLDRLPDIDWSSPENVVEDFKDILHTIDQYDQVALGPAYATDITKFKTTRDRFRQLLRDVSNNPSSINEEQINQRIQAFNTQLGIIEQQAYFNPDNARAARLLNPSYARALREHEDGLVAARERVAIQSSEPDVIAPETTADAAEQIDEIATEIEAEAKPKPAKKRGRPRKKPEVSPIEDPAQPLPDPTPAVAETLPPAEKPKRTRKPKQPDQELIDEMKPAMEPVPRRSDQRTQDQAGPESAPSEPAAPEPPPSGPDEPAGDDPIGWEGKPSIAWNTVDRLYEAQIITDRAHALLNTRMKVEGLPGAGKNGREISVADYYLLQRRLLGDKNKAINRTLIELRKHKEDVGEMTGDWAPAKLRTAFNYWDIATNNIRERILFNTYTAPMLIALNAAGNSVNMMLHGDWQQARDQLRPSYIIAAYRAVRDDKMAWMYDTGIGKFFDDIGSDIGRDASINLMREGAPHEHRFGFSKILDKVQTSDPVAAKNIRRALTAAGVRGSEFMYDLHSAVELVGRMAETEKHTRMISHPKHLQEWAGELLRGEYAQGDAKKLLGDLMKDGPFSADDVRFYALKNGFDNDVAVGIAQKWGDHANAAMSEGADYANQVLFSYNYTNADDLLRKVFLFHYWYMRASTKYVRALVRNPYLMINYQRAIEGLERESEGQPNAVRGMLKAFSGPGGFLIWIDPFKAIQTAATFNRQAIDEGDQKRFDSFMSQTGMFLNPMLQAAAAVLGLSENRGIDPTGSSPVRRILGTTANLVSGEFGWQYQGTPFQDAVGGAVESMSDFIRERNSYQSSDASNRIMIRNSILDAVMKKHGIAQGTPLAEWDPTAVNELELELSNFDSGVPSEITDKAYRDWSRAKFLQTAVAAMLPVSSSLRSESRDNRLNINRAEPFDQTPTEGELQITQSSPESMSLTLRNEQFGSLFPSGELGRVRTSPTTGQSQQEVLAQPGMEVMRSFKAWQQQARQFGPAEFRNYMMQASPQYRRYIEQLPSEFTSDPERFDNLSVGYQAFLAANGKRVSMYEPNALPASNPSAMDPAMQLFAWMQQNGYTSEQQPYRRFPL